MTGKKPFFFHKFNTEVLTQSQKPKEGTTGNNPNEWKSTVWSEEERLFIPDNYLFSSIVGGGKHVKVGRGTISKNLAGTVEITGARFYFSNRTLPKPIEEIEEGDISKDPSKDIYIDMRMVANPNTKGRNVRYRLALSPGWEVEASCEFDDSVISPDQMKTAIECAGKFVGIGDARAIGYGRFNIEFV